MKPRIVDYQELLDCCFSLEAQINYLGDAIRRRGSSAEVYFLALEVVDRACAIAKADLVKALRPPDEFRDPKG